MLGTILFQQVFDLTDEETVTQMAFNLQWHYALDIPEESDEVKYLSAEDPLEHAHDRDRSEFGYRSV